MDSASGAGESTGPSAAASSTRRAWFALGALWLAFELPAAWGPGGFAAVRPTGEFLCLLTVYGATRRSPRGLAVRGLEGVLVVFAAVLVLVRLDRAVYFFLTRSEPLLYDQLFMLRHLFVLVGDLWSWPLAGGLVAFVAIVTALVIGSAWLLRRATPLFEGARAARTARVFGAAWFAVLVATAVSSGSPRPGVRWMVPDLARNLSESRRMYRAVASAPSRTPYAGYSAIRLHRKPDVFVFFVESYGKLLPAQPRLRPAWVEEMHGLEERLSRNGWHMASAYSTAPVSGGRSWLAVSSLWLGITVRYETVFRQLMGSIDRLPTFVRFMKEQGYTTIHLAPNDRPRPGIVTENPYGWERYLAFRDIAYRGPKFGWGIVPDQYSLGYAEEHVLSTAHRPVFFNFHMVSSHATWDAVPPVVPDYRTLNEAEGGRPSLTSSEIASRLERYTRADPRTSYMGALTAALAERYARTVYYDFRVLSDFLSRRTDDAIVIVMGDHQPPLVSPETEGFEVPVHVFARDERLLAEFNDRGFTPGLVLGADRGAVIEHAGMFSLLVRALVRGGEDGGGGVTAPPYLPQGMPLGM